MDPPWLVTTLTMRGFSVYFLQMLQVNACSSLIHLGIRCQFCITINHTLRHLLLLLTMFQLTREIQSPMRGEWHAYNGQQKNSLLPKVDTNNQY